MVPVLSQDLLEMVIDELGQDRDRYPSSRILSKEAKTALNACALLSSTLRPRAQYHLFSVVGVNQIETATTMREIVVSNLNIARSVKHFKTDLSYGIDRSEGSEMLERSLFKIISLLQLLPNIEHLILRSITFGDHWKASFLEYLYDFIPNTITYLSCEYCVFVNSSQLTALLRAFRSPLRYLWIKTCSVDDEDTSDIPVPSALIALRCSLISSPLGCSARCPCR
jgi:hypothetical protein